MGVRLEKGATVGFLGVGLMGWGMAKNAVEKGYPLRVMAHRKREAVEDLVARGAAEVASPAEMAAQCDAIVMVVTGSPQVEALINGPNGILAGARDGLVIIDSGTSEPPETERHAAALAERGITLLDAPLSKSAAQAWEGDLTTYVGGAEDDIARVRPLLETWATTIIPTGGAVGSAHAVKLINNSVGIGCAAVWAEAYAMMEQVGIAPKVLHEVISSSGLNCGNFQNVSAYVIENDPNRHKFAMSNCLKDITYFQKLATAHRASTLMGDAAKQFLTLGANQGLEERYMTQMVDVPRALNKKAE